MIEYIIAIPSYKRSEQLQQKTLSCLYNAGIKKELINVFVIQDEYDDYLATLDKNYYNKLIVGDLGLVPQREFIQNYYPIGTNIISLDDDVEYIDLSLTKYTSLDWFFQDAFQKCKENNSYIWSVYPVYNPFFRQARPEINKGLLFCIGAFYGYINRNDDDLRISIIRQGNKEDVERSILYWLKDNIILRFDRIGFKTKYYGTGGLGGLKQRIPIMKQDAIDLNNKYPELTKIKVRKNGLYEIVFKKQKINIPINNMTVQVLPLIDPSDDDLLNLFDLLENTNIQLCSRKQGRARTFGTHRAITLGYVKARVSRKYGLSGQTLKNPDLYAVIKAFGEKICPFEFTSIHVNKNVVCPRHLDPKNVGKSMLVSFGDYEGCDLVIEGEGTFNTNCKPIIFDGSKSYHYNTPLTNGTKYSLVFFNTTS